MNTPRFVTVISAVVFCLAAYSVVLAQDGHSVYLPALQSGDAAPSAEPSATPTFTPIPTNTPTKTPTPTATEDTGDVIVLDNSLADFYGDRSFVAVGEVLNLTASNVTAILVTVGVFAENDQLLATGSGLAKLSVLEPGQSTCFWVSIPSAPANIAYYAFATDYLVGGTTAQGLSSQNVTEQFYPIENKLAVTGQVHNGGQVEARWVQTVLTLYFPTNLVLGCGGNFVQGFHIQPSSTASFGLSALSVTASAVIDSYRLQVQGQLP